MADARLTVRVECITELATDILGLHLAPVSGEALPAVEAGAHIDIELPNGLVRQYSLCNPGEEPTHYELGILNDPNSRGGSAWIHSELKEGQLLKISTPRNLFPLVECDKAVLIAGGIGITPIRAMAEALYKQGKDFELHYCARSGDRAAYSEAMQNGEWSDRVHCYFDSEDQRLDALALLSKENIGSHLFCCGPVGLIDWIQQQAREAGWSEDRIHFERFSADSDAQMEGDAFEIQLYRSGQIIPVSEGQSAAQAMLAAGVNLPISCEQGICGSCLVDVIDGQPDHRDMYQTEAEKASNQQFTPCCSRSRSRRLVVDL